MSEQTATISWYSAKVTGKNYTLHLGRYGFYLGMEVYVTLNSFPQADGSVLKQVKVFNGNHAIRELTQEQARACLTLGNKLEGKAAKDIFELYQQELWR